ncbi:hypothetical protein DsansV1_C02g0016851 [Dioscorea sansibarensis]
MSVSTGIPEPLTADTIFKDYKPTGAFLFPGQGAAVSRRTY